MGYFLLEIEFFWNERTQVLIKHAHMQFLSSFSMMDKIVV